MIKRESSCPLCGASLSVTELLDACTGLVDARLGVLSAHCPHCQGYLELLPGSGRVDIGYTLGTDTLRFEAAISLPCDGLEPGRSKNPASLTLTAPGRHWSFPE